MNLFMGQALSIWTTDHEVPGDKGQTRKILITARRLAKIGHRLDCCYGDCQKQFTLIPFEGEPTLDLDADLPTSVVKLADDPAYGSLGLVINIHSRALGCKIAELRLTWLHRLLMARLYSRIEDGSMGFDTYYSLTDSNPILP